MGKPPRSPARPFPKLNLAASPKPSAPLRSKNSAASGLTTMTSATTREVHKNNTNIKRFYSFFSFLKINIQINIKWNQKCSEKRLEEKKKTLRNRSKIRFYSFEIFLVVSLLTLLSCRWDTSVSFSASPPLSGRLELYFLCFRSKRIYFYFLCNTFF